MSDTKKKILVLNPASIEKAIKVANTLETKNGPFEAVLCLGDILSDGESTENLSKSVVPFYFTEGYKDLSSLDNQRETSNLNMLRPMGRVKLSCGLLLGYLAGKAEELTDKEVSEYFSDQLIDIFIAFKWPQAIGREQKLSLVGSSKVDIAVKLSKPKYVFGVGTEAGRFYERDLFQWPDGRQTRFISLARQGTKDKWHYAFSITPGQTEEALLEASKTSPNPFLESEENSLDRKRPHSSVSLPPIPKNAAAKRMKPVGPKNCFFCLSNPNVSLHLVVSIGNYAYITAAKGPLCLKNESIPFSGHGIIIPIAHVATLKDFCEIDETSESANMLQTPMMNEVLRYQVGILKMFKSLTVSIDYSVVFWEISRQTGIHFHTQFVPVPTELLDNFETVMNAQIKTNNETFARNMALKFQKVDSEDVDGNERLNAILKSRDYMLITVATSTIKQTKYIFDLNKAEGMLDLQFPRRLLATILETPERTYWDKCKLSVKEETEDTEAFKRSFEKFDPTI
ncbi:unnamed protein product [Kuraishia capsulata CBS 1993]|uniref:Cwf19-like C-terminal domain-containing protein n=1 Tax=Kuraishia capsulata CBS 1993 TaxID=1382522 RepID=W6MHZ9_9ASCO|nr:uncharacterized protein KUCA_T00001666001 [Kuraishia capsulata CBS 1993]CDK25696.1 unnamed protein product [Kuraishia capsulata CBS 1993]